MVLADRWPFLTLRVQTLRWLSRGQRLVQPPRAKGPRLQGRGPIAARDHRLGQELKELVQREDLRPFLALKVQKQMWSRRQILVQPQRAKGPRLLG